MATSRALNEYVSAHAYEEPPSQHARVGVANAGNFEHRGHAVKGAPSGIVWVGFLFVASAYLVKVLCLFTLSSPHHLSKQAWSTPGITSPAIATSPASLWVRIRFL